MSRKGSYRAVPRPPAWRQYWWSTCPAPSELLLRALQFQYWMYWTHQCSNYFVWIKFSYQKLLSAFLLITCRLHSNFRKVSESTLRCCHCKYHSLLTYFPWSLVKYELKGCSMWNSIKITSAFYIREAREKQNQRPCVLWILLTVWLISISVLDYSRTVEHICLWHPLHRCLPVVVPSCPAVF